MARRRKKLTDDELGTLLSAAAEGVAYNILADLGISVSTWDLEAPGRDGFDGFAFAPPGERAERLLRILERKRLV